MTSLPVGDDWAFEVKWDGYRTIVHVADGKVRLQSTAGHDVTARWPEFADLAASVNASAAVLDSELVVFDDEGRPRFELVQNSGVGSTRQAVLQVFDVLSMDGTDTIELAYEDRRRLLDQLVEPGDNWVVSPYRVGNGEDLLEATRERGLEGVMAKRLGSTYRPGTRSKDWRKVKNRQRVELTIGGYTRGSGNRSSTFGALLVGVPDPDSGDAAIRRRCGHRVQPPHAGVAHGSDARPAERRLPVRTDPADELPARRRVGPSRTPLRRRDRRVHERGLRPPRQLHRADLSKRTRPAGSETDPT